MILLFLDSEGTLRTKKVLSYYDEILFHYKNKNVKTILSTGLPKNKMEDVYNSSCFDIGMYSNGAHIVDNDINQEIYYQKIDDYDAHSIIELCLQNHLKLIVNIHGKEYTNSIKKEDKNTVLVDDNELLSLSDICQIYVFEELEDIDKEKYLNDFYNSRICLKHYKQVIDSIDDIDEKCHRASFYIIRKLRLYILNRFDVTSNNYYFRKTSFGKKEANWMSFNYISISKSYGANIIDDYFFNDNTILAIGDGKNDMNLFSLADYAIIIGKWNYVSSFSKNILHIKRTKLEFILYLLGSYLDLQNSLELFYNDIANINLNKISRIANLGSSKKTIDMIRYASRGIIKYGDKLALFYKKRIGELKLPGGGIEKNERPIDAFLREVDEEVGCEIDNLELVGYTIERKGKTYFKQVSFIFVANAKNMEDNHPTQEELSDDAIRVFYSLEDTYKYLEKAADNLVNLSTTNLYHEKFIVQRDFKILKYVFGK